MHCTRSTSDLTGTYHVDLPAVESNQQAVYGRGAASPTCLHATCLQTHNYPQLSLLFIVDDGWTYGHVVCHSM
jgi:hypothetical protein